MGQTFQKLTTEIEEHKKAASSVGLHLQQSCLQENSADFGWENKVMSNNQTKLLTLEAIHIREEKPDMNPSEEFRSGELPQKFGLIKFSVS